MPVNEKSIEIDVRKDDEGEGDAMVDVGDDAEVPFGEALNDDAIEQEDEERQRRGGVVPDCKLFILSKSIL